MKKSVIKNITAVMTSVFIGISSMICPSNMKTSASSEPETTMISLDEFINSRLSSDYIGIYYDEYDNEAFINNTGDSLVLWKVYGSNGRYNRGQANSGWHISSGNESTSDDGMYATLSNGYYYYQGAWYTLNSSVTLTGNVVLTDYGTYQYATIYIYASNGVLLQKFVQVH